MAKGNLANALAEIFPFEGGFTNDRRDPGNWTGGKVGVGELRGTNMGIAAHAHPTVDIKNLTKAQAEEIYRRKYATPLSFDNLRIGDDLVILDFGINSGVSRSAKYTQSISGVTQDGRIGPITLGAVAKIPSRDFIKRLCARRLSFVQSLAIWNTFGKGWSRRIAHMEAKALSWVSSKPQLEQDANEARGKAAGQGGAAIGTGGAGVADQATGATGLPVGVIVALAAIIIGALVVRAIIHSQRAAALGKAAKEA